MEMFRAKWADGKFTPTGNYAPSRLGELLAEGELVNLEMARDRSMKSHRHQFAELRSAFDSLPERLLDMPYAQSTETLRKHALIVTGFADVETIDAGSKAAAERVAAYAGKLATKAHGYAIVTVKGPIVRCFTPHSQSVRAMDAQTFQRSKTRMIDWLAALLETTPERLRGAA